MTLEKLDPLDLKLVAKLEANARKSYEDIANDLNIRRTTVAFRIQRLLHNNIIRITCWADPLAMGSKKLKAVAVNGTKEVPVPDKNIVSEVFKEYTGLLSGEFYERMKKWGTCGDNANATSLCAVNTTDFCSIHPKKVGRVDRGELNALTNTECL